MFCLVGLVPKEGLESQSRGGEREMKVEMEEKETKSDHLVSPNHDYFRVPVSSETETGVQLKTSVSFEFLSPELRTVIYLIFPDQRDVSQLSGPEPTA